MMDFEPITAHSKIRSGVHCQFVLRKFQTQNISEVPTINRVSLARREKFKQSIFRQLWHRAINTQVVLLCVTEQYVGNTPAKGRQLDKPGFGAKLLKISRWYKECRLLPRLQEETPKTLRYRLSWIQRVQMAALTSRGDSKSVGAQPSFEYFSTEVHKKKSKRKGSMNFVDIEAACLLISY